MTAAAKKIFQEAITLTTDECASLLEELLSSMDKPNPEIDKLWAKEVEDRLAAYHRGDLNSYPADEIFAQLGKS
jgi:Glu-tRNA(Gln) amidotransferase subunit E-like FAD-binding protein